MKRRYHITIRGAVQGVGFRPFIFRLATSHQLSGWVNNSPTGVFIDVEGEEPALNEFLLCIEREKPVNAFIQSLEYSALDPAGYDRFEIRPSKPGGQATALILPDIVVCDECVRELFDPTDRRYLYPFINCTHCGPRYTIIDRLPYDRANTTMRSFPMCPDCRAEYENPAHRRFHAEPIACPVCGPSIQLFSAGGTLLAERNDVIQKVGEAIRSGKIVAVKGIGGFHLLADATSDDAVRNLRDRKQREEKPFAVMFPDSATITGTCEVDPLEDRLLRSPESPIVLLRRNQIDQPRKVRISTLVAPGNPTIGVMLPYTPLHHLLMREIGRPVVATSGNISDEPICIDNDDALRRLGKIADLFLMHNRQILRHVDDSVVRIALGREYLLRRARGYAPLPISLDLRNREYILAVGAQLKNSIAISAGQQLFISQHIGDLETEQSFKAFTSVIGDLSKMYDFHPDRVVSDCHPDYLSTRYASSLPVEREEVQHHYAHVASCMAENRLDGSLLGVSWDGTGFGPDGTVWGGEFLLTDDLSFRRAATFRPFRLIGGDQAVREPRRTALGVLYEIFGEELFVNRRLAPVRSCSATEIQVFGTMLRNGVQSPITTSAGRLFDAVASIIGIRQITKFEGQAAMELEFALEGEQGDDCYAIRLEEPESGMMVIDWAPMIVDILADVEHILPVRHISLKFHNTLVESILCVARKVGSKRVVLTGGCFQNMYLLTRTVRRLENDGFLPYWHQRIPTNDGGIALGQIYASVRAHKEKQLLDVGASDNES